MQSRSLWARAALLVVPVVLFAAVACGSDDEKTPSSTGGASAGAAVSTGTINMLDNKFEPANLTVKANQETTLVLDNKGTAIHNWHVLNVKGKDGKEVTTALNPAGKSETIKFTFDKPGTYDVHCDVHPAEMKGKLTVQ